MLFVFIRYQSGKGDIPNLGVLKLEIIMTSLVLPIPVCICHVPIGIIWATVVPPYP